MSKNLSALYRADAGTGHQVRVFALRYRQAGHKSTPNSSLQQIAEATGGVFADATPADIDTVLNEMTLYDF
jgi:hypothetical protein